MMLMQLKIWQFLLLIAGTVMVLFYFSGGTEGNPFRSDVPEQISGTLVKIHTRGGLCPNNEICSSTVEIKADGTITGSNKTARVSIDLAEALENAINKTNFQQIKGNPYMGLCPTAYDGVETIYTFYTLKGSEEISSCEYYLQTATELSSILETIAKQIY